MAPRLAGVSPTADPTALPGNGARVVPRPAGALRRREETSGTGRERTAQERGRDGETPEELGHGEAFRGR